MVIDINGNGIPNADILIYNNSFTYNSTSDNSGNFSISGIYEGNYDVIAGSWGFVTSCTNEFISSANADQIILQEGYYDDFTFDFGWSVSGGIFSPNDGIWQRGDPEQTSFNGSDFNPENDINNDCFNYAYVTGLNSGPYVGARDVDEANTILTSPVFDLSFPLNSNNNYYLNYNLWLIMMLGGGTPK